MRYLLGGAMDPMLKQQQRDQIVAERVGIGGIGAGDPGCLRRTIRVSRELRAPLVDEREQRAKLGGFCSAQAYARRHGGILWES